MLTLLACSDFSIVHEKPVPEDTGDTDPIVDTDTTDTDTTDTDTTDTDTTDTDTTPPLECGKILVYSTEGERSGNTGIFDDIRSDPALAAYDVELVEQATDGALTEAMLAGKSQLWVLGTWADPGTTFELSQVSAIRDFVEAGYGLLLAGGGVDGGTDYTDDVNLLAQLWGVRYTDSYDEGEGALAIAGAAGPLVSGVTEVPAFAATADLELEDAAVNVAFRLGGHDAVAWREGDARIVFDRSWQGYTDEARAVGDQAAYVANVAGFLEPCP